MARGVRRLAGLGAEEVSFAGPPGVAVPAGNRSRRSTFERALRATAETADDLVLSTGHVEEVLVRGGRAVGVRVDGVPLEADLVVDASGRAGRVPGTPGVSHEERAGDCGMAYVDRVYRLHEGAEPGPMANPVAWIAESTGTWPWCSSTNGAST